MNRPRTDLAEWRGTGNTTVLQRMAVPTGDPKLDALRKRLHDRLSSEDDARNRRREAMVDAVINRSYGAVVTDEVDEDSPVARAHRMGV